MNSVVRIPFHGDEIWTVDVQGQPHIVLKPAVEALGLDYPTQYTKLRSRSWATVGQRPMVAEDGKQREMTTCDVRTFLMLLATIDEKRVGKDVAPKLVMYQAEVADAIEQYWTKGGAINPRATDDQLAAITARAKAQAEVLRVLDGIVDRSWLEAKAREVAGRALGEEPDQDSSTRLLTVGEYLDEQGVTGTAARKLAPAFGKQIKALYVRRHGESPGTSRRFVDGAQRDVAVYTEQDRDLFDQVWHSLTDGGA
ncbi:P22-like antirepressor protein [Haloactinospora alba]|uniref:P22-like antirepressor protein n=1 Tax=Haloactinospora alba TaxID=405555 RepID=A0A543NFG1_9ACTN|nr:phage antirepressor N-terminal domain-containing protein [Haloactinospora alba]TQN30572.1 P22-like antirepressor protein [Haloactinospora alba]